MVRPLPEIIIGLEANRDEHLRVLVDYAEFWKLPYKISSDRTRPGTLKPILCSGQPRQKPNPTDTIVVSPSGIDDARRIAQEYDLTLQVSTKTVSLPLSLETRVSVETENYEFKGTRLEPMILDGSRAIMTRIHDTRTNILSIDLVSAHERLMHGINDPPHRKFRLVTRLKGSYGLIPRFVRERAFRNPEGRKELRRERIAPMECLRLIFLASLLKASQQPIPFISFWRDGKEYAVAVTHDIETREGLEDGAGRLFDVEQKLGIRSTWNIPSARYHLSNTLVTKLADAGQLGAHDTKHDGRLILEDFQKKVDRLSSCRLTLGKVAGRDVRGFRAPLLQHSPELLAAVAKAGYTHDSSVPSWEILSPTSLGPHGVGTVFPLKIGGLVELPVSLPQDHQLLRVIGLDTGESVSLLHSLSQWIKRIGGLCVILVHPDYEFGWREHQAAYEQLLEPYAKDPKCDIMTLEQVAEWWTRRQEASWTLEHGRSKLIGEGLEVKLATGFDDETGLKTEACMT